MPFAFTAWFVFSLPCPDPVQPNVHPSGNVALARSRPSSRIMENENTGHRREGRVAFFMLVFCLFNPPIQGGECSGGVGRMSVNQAMPIMGAEGCSGARPGGWQGRACLGGACLCHASHRHNAHSTGGHTTRGRHHLGAARIQNKQR